MENRSQNSAHPPFIRLTKTVQKGGCAAKVAATELKSILRKVQFPPAQPELIVDGRHFDDAAIYKISDSVAMVQTIDFFTPILDSPRAFGRVAAVNALSDVYAMGGRPVTALAVLAFPLATLPGEVISEVLQGAADALAEAKASLAGGHSIDDDTLKFGLSVSGLVNPQHIWTNAGAKPGDALILTKGLGTGTLTAALKRDAMSESEIQHAIDSMSTLNNAIDFLEPAGLAAYVHAATDITGFGLSGHGMQCALASRTSFEISAAALPRLAGAEDCLKREFLTKAHRTNREYTSGQIDDSRLDPITQLLIHDPQTSGGLLLAVDESRANDLIKALRPAFPLAAVIGHVRAERADGLKVAFTK
jgi:selenide,water dikinase